MVFNEKFTNVIFRVLDLHDNSTLDRVCLRFCFRLTHTREEPQEPDLADIVEWEARVCTNKTLLLFMTLFITYYANLRFQFQSMVDLWGRDCWKVLQIPPDR